MTEEPSVANDESERTEERHPPPSSLDREEVVRADANGSAEQQPGGGEGIGPPSRSSGPSSPSPLRRVRPFVPPPLRRRRDPAVSGSLSLLLVMGPVLSRRDARLRPPARGGGGATRPPEREIVGASPPGNHGGRRRRRSCGRRPPTRARRTPVAITAADGPWRAFKTKAARDGSLDFAVAGDDSGRSDDGALPAPSSDDPPAPSSDASAPDDARRATNLRSFARSRI